MPRRLGECTTLKLFFQITACCRHPGGKETGNTQSNSWQFEEGPFTLMIFSRKNSTNIYTSLFYFQIYQISFFYYLRELSTPISSSFFYFKGNNSWYQNQSDIRRKENYIQISVMNIVTETLSKMLTNQIQWHRKRIIHQCFASCNGQCENEIEEKSIYNIIKIKIFRNIFNKRNTELIFWKLENIVETKKT